MKAFFTLLLCFPLLVWGQPDTLTPIQKGNLKPIKNDLLPAYYGRYGGSVRTQYTYDGLDVRHAKDLGQYIMASGDPSAIREFQSYITSRHAGGWIIAGGLITAIVGGAIMSSNGPDSDGQFHTTQPIPCPTGYICGGSMSMTVVDTHRQRVFGTGSALLLGGAVLAGIGWGLNRPGKHLRSAVQYYNRALKQQGVSWRLTPYSSYSNSGVGLVGKF